MLIVSDAYLSAINADTRDMPYRVTLAGTSVFTQNQVPKMTLTENMGGASGVALGAAYSATLKLTIRGAGVIDYTDMLIEPESGLVLPDGSTEWVPLGRFWATNHSTNNDYETVELTCSDGMYLMTGEYVTELTYPTDIQNVVHEVISKTGVSFVEPTEWPEVIVRRKPEGKTYRDVIAYLAGCCGCNARFNRHGELEFTWYRDSGVTIERKTQYLGGMTRLNDKPLEVTFEITGAEETYNITINTDENGGVIPTPGTGIVEGETVTLSVKPYVGYELAEISAVTDAENEITLLMDAENAGYTFVQPDSNVTVTASFRESAEGPFKLTTRSQGHGSIGYVYGANEEGFEVGEKVELVITPEDGYELDRLVVIPASVEIASDHTFVMPQSDVTINAYFKEASTYYTIERIVDYHGSSTTPGYIVIENLTAGGYQYSAGDTIAVRFSRATGFVFDYYESNIEMTQVDNDDFHFVMPAENVSITAHFKWEEDESKTNQYSWLDLPQYNTPPTDKPYWAIFYKDDWSAPTCKKYHLVWFDSWKATGYSTDYNKRLYSVTFDGYYYCGSQDTGHLPHAWDTSVWSGNGAAGSTLEWDVYVGGHAWSGGTILGSCEYCLLATNCHLYYNSSLIFKKCENALQFPRTSYVVDGMDVREKGSLTYWKCPDTFSTPAPASNWMIVETGGALCMTPDEDGSGYSRADSCDGLYILFFDSIAIEKVGAVFNNSDEEFYIATVTNGHYCALKAETSSTSWTLYDVADGDVIGLRSPLVSCRETHGSLGGYYFSGVFATTVNLWSMGELFMYKNDCRACDCVAEVSTFSLRRASVSTDKVTISYTNPLIYEKMLPGIAEVVQGITYTPAKVKHRGNPALQAGDIVSVPDKNGEYHTVLIIQQTMTFGGGMNSEITCPGQTAQTNSFSSNGPITTQIKNEVASAVAKSTQQMSQNNAQVYSAMYQTMSGSEKKIQSQMFEQQASFVKMQSETNASIAEIKQTVTKNEADIESLVTWKGTESASLAKVEQKANENEASIESQAKLITENSESIAQVTQRVEENEASIGLVVDNGTVKGGVIIEAINDETTAKISADRLDIEGKELNIKVAATNIEGELNAEQINTDGITVKEGDIGGYVVDENSISSGNAGLRSDEFMGTSLVDGSESPVRFYAGIQTRTTVGSGSAKGSITGMYYTFTPPESVPCLRILEATVSCMADNGATIPVSSVTIVDKTISIYVQQANSATTTYMLAITYTYEYEYQLSRFVVLDDGSVKASAISTQHFEAINGVKIGDLPETDANYHSVFVGGDGGLRYGAGRIIYYATHDDATPFTAIEISKNNLALHGTVQGDSGIISTSSRVKKHDIEAMTDKYLTLFDNLNPVRFKYNNGTSGRYHTGLVLDELKTAMDIAELDSSELAAYCVSNNETGDGGIRYEELIPILILKIKALEKEIQKGRTEGG